jgi:DHA3 family tetracycline resistance protein-like MFS transporter
MQLLRANPPFRRLAAAFVLTVPFRDYLGSLYQPHLGSAGVPAVWFGVVLAVASALNLLGARLAHAVESRVGTRAGLILSSAAPGVLYVAMALARQPLPAVLAFCLLYGSMSLRRPIFAGQLNLHIDSRSRATVLSMLSMVSGIHVALMGLLIGRIADASVPVSLVVTGALVLAGTGLLLVWRQPGREAGTPPSGEGKARVRQA